MEIIQATGNRQLRQLVSLPRENLNNLEKTDATPDCFASGLRGTNSVSSVVEYKFVIVTSSHVLSTDLKSENWLKAPIIGLSWKKQLFQIQLYA